MKKKSLLIILVLFLCGCATYSTNNKEGLPGIWICRDWLGNEFEYVAWNNPSKYWGCEYLGLYREEIP